MIKAIIESKKDFNGLPALNLFWHGSTPSWVRFGTGTANMRIYSNGDWVQFSSGEYGEKSSKEVMHCLTKEQAIALRDYLIANIKD